MGASKLYKYLDINGGLQMLKHSNLQFTNATRLNDPFDCHPSLIDFSRIPNEQFQIRDKEIIIRLESNRYERLRNHTWICSLSKIYDSLLMWSYYGNHRGVCIGLDMAKTNKYLSRIYCQVYIGSMEFEVQYEDIIKKPDYFRERKDYFRYQLSTKAKAWEHEQEVRLVLISPTSVFTPMALPYQPKDENEVVDWKEFRAYPPIGGECFESLYLGISIDKEQKENIIKIAKEINPNIAIYQMTIDPDAFRLKEEYVKLENIEFNHNK